MKIIKMENKYIMSENNSVNSFKIRFFFYSTSGYVQVCQMWASWLRFSADVVE